MDTPSTWWTEDFVDLTNFTTTVVDEQANNQLSSVAGESDANPVMKMEEINSLIGVPNFSWLEEEDNVSMVKNTSNSLTTGISNVGKPRINSSGGKALNSLSNAFPGSNFRNPNSNASLVKRRDTQLKLDFTLVANETSQLSSNSPQNIIQTSQVPSAKKELNLTTPDILGPLTDKNSEFNLLAYVFQEDKFANDVASKDLSVLNTPEIKVEQVEVEELLRPGTKVTPPTAITGLIAIKEEPKELEEAIGTKKENDWKDVKASAVKTKPVWDTNSKETKKKWEQEEEKVAVVEPRIKIKIELDEYRPVIFRHKNKSLSDDILFPRKKRKLSTTSEESTLTDDKYRELRDKNNEASRRSRLNRKSREVEMKAQSEDLEATNRRLKAKAEELQKLVDRLRKTLMEVMVRKSS